IKLKNRKLPVFQISEKSYVCSPEYLLFDLLDMLPRSMFAIVASELCASFLVVKRNGKSSIVRARPVTSISSIKNFAKQYLAENSAKALMAGVKYCVENAFSPPEIAVALLFHFAPQSGGYGMTKPCLNPKMTIETNLRYAQNLDVRYEGGGQKIHIKPDLYWPKHKLIIEYDSAQFHDGNIAYGSDLQRRSAFGKSGYTVVNVSKDQLRSVEAFHDVGQNVLRICGKRFSNYSASSVSRNKLHRILQGYLRSGVSL
ncbi:MAG: hypothetical protein HUJ63_06755, partial [Enterococcus sp.]|nr:hypothetical protein [Enterococcus sp.]